MTHGGGGLRKVQKSVTYYLNCPELQNIIIQFNLIINVPAHGHQVWPAKLITMYLKKYRTIKHTIKQTADVMKTALCRSSLLLILLSTKYNDSYIVQH